MRRFMFPIVCGWMVAVALGASSSAARVPDVAETRSLAEATSQPEAPAPELRVCYWACDTWFLYPTYEACIEECGGFCERRCF